MTTEAQRIAIALWFKSQVGKLEIAIDDDGAEYEAMPDIEDLNAIHELEQCAFKQGLQRDFVRALDKKGKVRWDDIAGLISATAAQRAEALLRTIGKWDDSK